MLPESNLDLANLMTDPAMYMKMKYSMRGTDQLAGILLLSSETNLVRIIHQTGSLKRIKVNYPYYQIVNYSRVLNILSFYRWCICK